MNMFSVIFWSCVVADLVVPGVNIAIGWYVLWGLLACMS